MGWKFNPFTQKLDYDSGAKGQGVPVGGTAGQILAKIDGDDYNTHWIDNGGGTSLIAVNTFADLPTSPYPAADTLYIVRNTTGAWYTFNKKNAGMYRSTGIAWEFLPGALTLSQLADISISVEPGTCLLQYHPASKLWKPAVLQSADDHLTITPASDGTAMTLAVIPSICLAPTGIEFGSASQEYDITGTTWVTATAGGALGGVPASTANHQLVNCLTAVTTSRDGVYLSVRELAGVASATNPLTVQFLFSGVTTFDVIESRSYYTGSVAHNVDIQLWNFTTSAWDTYATFSGETGFVSRSIKVFNPALYISAGVVKLQFIHTSAGINTHHIEFDYIALCDGGGGGGSASIASAVKFTPTGNIEATNVQTALVELDAAKAAAQHDHENTNSGGLLPVDTFRIGLWSDEHYNGTTPNNGMIYSVADFANVLTDMLFSAGDHTDNGMDKQLAWGTWLKSNITDAGIPFNSVDGNHDIIRYNSITNTGGNTVITTGSYVSSTLTSQANSGQNQLTVADGSVFAAGRSIFVAAIVADTAAQTCEAFDIVSVVGNVITLNANLANTYAVGSRVEQGQDMATIYAAYRAANGAGNTEFGKQGVSRVHTWNNNVFITLGNEMPEGYLQTPSVMVPSDQALDWLEKQLAIYRGYNVFVISHFIVADSGLRSSFLVGLDPPDGASYYATNSARIKDICAANTITAWFSGHAHFKPNGVTGHTADDILKATPSGFGGTIFIGLPSLNSNNSWAHITMNVGDTGLTVKYREADSTSAWLNADETIILTYPIKRLTPRGTGEHTHDYKPQWIGATELSYNGNVAIGQETPPKNNRLTLKGDLGKALTGTVTVSPGSATVSGTNTLFSSELLIGSAVKIGTEIFTVSAIASSVSMTLDSNHVAGVSGATAYTDNPILIGLSGDTATTTVLWNGKLGLGDLNPRYRIDLKGTDGPGSLVRIRSEFDSSSGGGALALYHNRATGAQPQANDRLGYLTYGGMDGIVTRNSSVISAKAAANWVAGASPEYSSYLTFETTPTGANPTRTEKMRIWHNGIIGTNIGSGVNAASSIDLVGDITPIVAPGTIDTINLPYTGFVGTITLLCTSGTVTLSTAGNILIGGTIPAGGAKRLTWYPSGNKWYVH